MSAMTTAVTACLNGRIGPHELPGPLHDLWRDGFHAGQRAAAIRVQRAEHDADYWYFRANNPAEARAAHEEALRDFDIRQRRNEIREAWALLDELDGAVTDNTETEQDA